MNLASKCSENAICHQNAVTKREQKKNRINPPHTPTRAPRKCHEKADQILRMPGYLQCAHRNVTQCSPMMKEISGGAIRLQSPALAHPEPPRHRPRQPAPPPLRRNRRSHVLGEAGRRRGRRKSGHHLVVLITTQRQRAQLLSRRTQRLVARAGGGRATALGREEADGGAAVVFAIVVVLEVESVEGVLRRREAAALRGEDP